MAETPKTEEIESTASSDTSFDASFDAEDYEHLLDDYTHFVPPAANEVLQGSVLKVTAKEVIVDFGSSPKASSRSSSS